MQLRSRAKAILLVVALAAPCLWAQDGLRGALSNYAHAPGEIAYSNGSVLLAADFDNDKKPDGALLLDAGVIDGQKMYRVEMHLSAGTNHDLVFAANDPTLTISAEDVNQDGLPDLTVEQAFTHKRIRVWLNDGHGKFRGARVEDFQAVADAPCGWRAPDPAPACLIPGLPSRFESHAAQSLEILRFESSSSQWRVWREAQPAKGFLFSSDSPRAPPFLFSL